jgi:aromatic ring-opening dioxygenase LigB subunit
MATNGDLALDEPHKTFDTILTLDFGSVTPTRFLHAKNRVVLTKSQISILSSDHETTA